MAENIRARRTGVAYGAIAPCRFVKFNANGPRNVAQATAGQSADGISQEWQKGTPGLTGSDTAVAAADGDPIMFHGMGEIALLEFGGTIDEGAFIKSDSNGKGVTTSTSGDYYSAKCIEAGASGEKKLVLVQAGLVA